MELVELSLGQEEWKNSGDGETIVILPSWFRRARNIALALFFALLGSFGSKALFKSLFVSWPGQLELLNEIFLFFLCGVRWLYLLHRQVQKFCWGQNHLPIQVGYLGSPFHGLLSLG